MAVDTTTFRTVLESAGGNNVCIVVPDEVVAQFNLDKRTPILVNVDSSYRYLKVRIVQKSPTNYSGRS